MTDDTYVLRIGAEAPKTLAWLAEQGLAPYEKGRYLVPKSLEAAQWAVFDAELTEQAERYFNDPGNVWTNVTTFEDLRNAMLGFIKGNEPMTPWHASPLAEESGAIKEKLRRLTELGFVTENSQPGLRNEFYRQRAYVAGLVETPTVAVLEAAATEHGYVWADNPEHQYEPEERICVTEKLSGEEVTWAPDGTAYPLDAAWIDGEGFQSVVKATTAVSIADPEWETNGMFDVLIEALEAR